MRIQSNVTSVVLSWLIAIGFLGLISIWSQPPATPPHAPALIKLSDQILQAAQSDISVLKASAWCALDSGQEAVLKTAHKELRFRGSMAIAPHWRGESLQNDEQARLEDCVALRLEQLNNNRRSGSALAFLFSDR